MFAISLVCHLVVLSLIIWLNASSVFHPSEEPVTYVDVVSLPVASPQAGTPAPAQQQAAPPAAPAPAPPKAAMALPAATPKAKTPPPEKGKAPKPPAPADEGREYQEHLAKLEQRAEDKRQAEVLARLKKGTGAGKTVGMPGAKGTQAGSDYAAYIQSRLKDAFKEVIASQSTAPQVLVRIAIAPDGHLANFRVEKKSGDPIFDDAVARAVTLAARNFKPPPGGVPFERVFRFKPEGVGLP